MILNSENGPRVKKTVMLTPQVILFGLCQTKKIIEKIDTKSNNQDPHEEMEGFIHGMKNFTGHEG